MCGILLVKSRKVIPLKKHLKALAQIESRGPDFSRYQHDGNIFIGQTVLHITGNDDYYNQEHTNFLAYNGEIYNYRQLGRYNNDIEFVDHAVNNDIAQLRDGWGPWAWAWTDGQQVRYATDPQGEKTLYQYQDDDILIVSSSIGPILEYRKLNKVDVPFENKHWTILDQTPWAGVKKIQPGQLYSNGYPVEEIDSVWSWIQPQTYKNFDQAYGEFKKTWQSVITAMTPKGGAALTFSGGLDSSLILNSIENLDLYSVNNIGKDPIVDRVRDFLQDLEQFRLHELRVTEEQWADNLKQLTAQTHMPVQSWSFVGQWIVSQACNQRVLFTGCAADELFGGYDVYRQLTYTPEHSASPYSRNGDPALWQRCLHAYGGDARQATLLMDYWHQIVGCDAIGVDQTSGAWGIEARSPFMAKPLIKFALSLPWEYKVGPVAKPLIRRAFLERWSEDLIMPKKGFTGHCNDSLKYLPVRIKPSRDRNQDWHQAIVKLFYKDSK